MIETNKPDIYDAVSEFREMGVNPYYQDDYATLYHGKCDELLPKINRKFCAMITDPPYNIGKKYGSYGDNLPPITYMKLMKLVVSHGERLCKRQAWVAPRYKMKQFLGLLKKSHIVVIRRGAIGPFRGGWSDQFETALVIGKPLKVFSDLWDDIRLKGEGYFFREETWGHPGYTPIPIMQRFCMLLAEESVIDPFSGTGTTLVAAKQLGIRSVGIEQEESYCEIAAKRLRQETFLFMETPKFEQKSLFENA